MADLPRYPDPNGDTGTPRWVKVFGIIVTVLERHRQRHRTRGATPVIMTPSLRKFALTAHVTSSIGWFGAVAAFLALAIAGLFSQDRELVRAAYLVMGLTTWFVIVPFAFVSLGSGVVSSLFTRWGL